MLPLELVHSTLSKVPAGILNALAFTVHNYWVPLIVDDVPRGTGVLARVDGVSGILTAEHVIYKSGFDNTVQSTQILTLPLTQYAGTATRETTTATDSVRIPIKHLRWYPENRSRDDYDGQGEYGPDLALIQLPEAGSWIETIESKKLFYNLTMGAERMEQALTDNGLLGVVGAPQRWIDMRGKVEGTELIRGIRSAVFLAGNQRYYEKDGFDFLEVIPDTPMRQDLPPSFRGVSGGGFFRFPRTKEIPADSWVQESRPILAGILYWESIREDSAFLRGHGPRSIYVTFLGRLREWFRAQTRAVP